MTQNELQRLSQEIAQYAGTEQIRMVRRYIQARIDYLREKSDTVTHEDLPKNQGAIAELKSLLKLTGQFHRQAEFDGAFGM